MDSDIRAAVHEELVTDPRIDADDIVIEIFNGEVSLNGTVPSQAQCSEATVAARRVAGATVVHNLLAIALPSRDYGDDTALTQLVNQALAANRAVPDGVRATAREGNIFLTGTVSHGVQRVAAEDAVAGVAMRADITWYDLLGALPDASSEDIQRAYDTKAALLRPELLSGAPSTVVTAAARAQGIIDAARQVLSDPVSRQRYDEAAGLWGSGGGLGEPRDSPAGSGLPDSDVAADNPGADVLHGLGALNLWLARHPDYQRRIPVPDVRGLFYDVFAGVVGRLDIRITFVQLTEHPMPVEGLVVGQSPRPPAKVHRRGELTVQVWHPPAPVTQDPPGASAAR